MNIADTLNLATFLSLSLFDWSGVCLFVCLSGDTMHMARLWHTALDKDFVGVVAVPCEYAHTMC
jgi:hypothetical protein